MDCNKIKDKLTEIYLTIDEADQKTKEYKDYVDCLCPQMKNFNFSVLNEYKNKFSSSKEFMENQKSIFFKLGSKKIIDIYTHYDILGYNFEDAINDFLCDIYEDDKTSRFTNLNEYYFSEYKFFVESIAERIFLTNFCSYAEGKPEILDKLGENINWTCFKEKDDTLDIVENNEKKEAIEKAFVSLSPKYEMVLKLHYGFKDDLSLTQIGQRYGVSGANIGRIHNEALEKLRNPCKTKVLEIFK